MLDVDPERMKPLYIAKLRACYRLADFSDSKKDLEFKEHKKECMIELIDTLDDATLAPQYLFNEAILKEAFKLVESNIFRTFTNKSNNTYPLLSFSDEEVVECGPGRGRAAPGGGMAALAASV